MAIGAHPDFQFGRNMNKYLNMRLLIFLLLGLLGLSANAQISADHYRVYAVKAGKEVTLETIVQDMASADVLFFGEEHNDSVGHYPEMTLLEMMNRSYPGKVALSMEMFDRDVQPVMNEYLRGGIKEKHFKKDARVWSNYADYQPMIEYARTNHLEVICANAASRYTNLAGREGQQALMALPQESRKFMAPLPYDTASGSYYDKLMALMGHTATDSAAPVPMATTMDGFSLIMAQSLWDATMAWSIAEYVKKHKGNKVFQVNGRFHSDEHFAIVTQLKSYSPKTKVLVISTGPDETFPFVDWSKFQQLGDYIIITDPNVPRTYDDF